MFFDIVLPLLGVCAYVFVYRAIGAPEDYVGFVVVGGAMIAFWMNVLWSMSSQLYWEKEQGNLALFILAPGPMMAILLGMALGGLLATTLRALVIMVLGTWFFDVQYAVASFPQLFAVFFLTMIALYGMGMMMASLFLLLSREAWHLSNLAHRADLPGIGLLFPDQKPELLGGCGGLDHTADAGHGRHAPACLCLRACAWLSSRSAWRSAS